MEDNHTYSLVKGQYTANEATDVLFSLVNSKIKFHELRAFGMKERSENDLHKSEMRSKELKLVLADIKSLIEFAQAENMELKISGNIDIQLIKV
jgi:hypothetical protein